MKSFYSEKYKTDNESPSSITKERLIEIKLNNIFKKSSYFSKLENCVLDFLNKSVDKFNNNEDFLFEEEQAIFNIHKILSKYASFDYKVEYIKENSFLTDDKRKQELEDLDNEKQRIQKNIDDLNNVLKELGYCNDKS